MHPEYIKKSILYFRTFGTTGKNLKKLGDAFRDFRKYRKGRWNYVKGEKKC
jgi:hypothetical protein